MIITKKQLSRRTLLKGLGVTVALPMLDAMTPALATAAEKAKAPTRLFFGAVPNGIEMKAWTPKGTGGKDFEFTRILKPLEAYREDLLILTGLAHRTGASKEAGDHARAGGNYLTGVHPKRTTGADIEVGISVDQVAAQGARQQDAPVFARTRLRSDAHGRQLRCGLQLRVPKQSGLAHAQHADAAGNQSASGL